MDETGNQEIESKISQLETGNQEIERRTFQLETEYKLIKKMVIWGLPALATFLSICFGIFFGIAKDTVAKKVEDSLGKRVEKQIEDKFGKNFDKIINEKIDKIINEKIDRIIVAAKTSEEIKLKSEQIADLLSELKKLKQRAEFTAIGANFTTGVVTNSEYKKFTDNTNRPAWSINDDMPAANITWYDAKAYCEWKGSRLLTKEEWMNHVKSSVPGFYEWTATGAPHEQAAICNFSDSGSKNSSVKSKNSTSDKITFRCLRSN